MRLFIAFDLPEAQKSRVEALVEAWRPRVDAKWTRAEGRHVTLCFLGETDEARVPEVKTKMDEVARRHAPHALRVVGAGCFGPPAQPRVLWLGLDGALAAARALQADLARALDVKDEHGAWAPHLTLARSKSPRGDAALVDVARALQRETFDEFLVADFVLFESRGGRYFPLHTAALARR
ncbi:MAG: RNA 2',3'-cyclic phosphodiesterase [Myxococcota bacterium]